MIFGMVLMLQWSAGNWDMHTLEVSMHFFEHKSRIEPFYESQLAEHTAMLTLVLAVDQSSWTMSSVPLVPNSY